jgi:transcriptional regulator with XRE-family HTH domain
VVTRSYFTNLRKGRIENPGYEKMLAIAKAMGFPPALWFEEAPGDGIQAEAAEGQNLASRVGHLLESIRHPETGEPYTDTQVARMSAGVLTEEEFKGIRTDKVPDPTVGQVAALAAVFGVPAFYLVDRGTDSSVLDKETLEALSANQEYHHSQYRHEPHCFPILYRSGQLFRSSVPCFWLMCHGYQIRLVCSPTLASMRLAASSWRHHLTRA